MKPYDKPKKIVDGIERKPADMLAIGRTKMANERTLLSFIRTSVGLLAGGIGLIKFLEHPFIVALGWILVPVSLFFLVWGVVRYIYSDRILKEVASRRISPNNDD